MLQLPWPLSINDNGRSPGTITEAFTVSCFLIFTLSFRASLCSLYCSAPLSHPLILPLCLCEEACSPAGRGCSDARLKGPRGERFLNPSCPPGLMQCISLLLGVFVRRSGRSITSHTRPTTILEPSSLLNTPPSSECCYPVLEYPLSVIRHNWHASLQSGISEQTPWQCRSEQNSKSE